MRIFPVIAGPTAGGKSAVAMHTARLLAEAGERAEIISADSMQLYRGMDIGTAKPDPQERAEVRHHLVDVCGPEESFTVDQWLEGAEGAIEDIRTRGGRPIVVGGTHLYIKALLEGLFRGPDPDPAVRAALASIDPSDLRVELERVDPEAAGRIHPNDLRRTIRALEVHRQTGRPISEWQRQWDQGARPDALLVVLNWPTEEINRRINARVRGMLEAGLVEEARSLWEAGRLGPQAREGLGYKQLLEHFQGSLTLDDAVERIKRETRRFAKNQRTWLRRLAAPTTRTDTEQKSPGASPPPAPLVLDAPGHRPEELAETIVRALFAPP